MATQKISLQGHVCAKYRWPHVVAGAAMMALWTFSAASPLAAAPEVEWVSGLLSVKARGQPLNAVLREVGSRTGAVIKGADGLTETVAADIDGVALVEGLRTLLSRHNYLIVEGTRARTGTASTRVFVVAPAVGGAMPLPALSPGLSSAAEARASVLSNPDPAQRIEAVERLGERHDERSLALLRQAAADPSTAVRAVAIEALQARGASVVAGPMGRTP